MVSLAKKNKGFTIVELLIVIVVIGILATLVIVTFTGIQQKGRNTQRQTDIKAVQGYVESFYAEYGFYPTGTDLTTPAFITKYMKGLDPKALVDPKQAQDGSATIATATVAAGTYQYSYVASNGSGGTCSTAASSTTSDPVDTGCDEYTLTAHMEGANTPDYIKKSN
jgi:prepilin-type N-terminal cleavage/methylation domain-containing protein